jgi:protein-tyrosine phosphatase
MWRAVKDKASASRRRYRKDDFDLDLSYITDRIIAMGIPASGVETAYRNSAVDVARFLHKYHSHRFVVLNCSLKSYDYSRFDNQVLDFGWPDHHSPPLNLLFQVCRAIHTWLEADPLNVVAVHCKAGKGRTGTVIASYLLYCQMFREYGEALNWFAEKRGAGVEMPSQIRYVKYMEDILERNSFPRRARYKLTRIMINGIPNIDGSGSFRPLVELYKENTELMFFAGSSKGFKSSPKRRSMKDGKLFSELSCSKELGLGLVKIVPEEEVELFGDILFVLKHIGFMGETRIGRFGFHTGFVHDGYIRFTHRDMDDAFKGTAILTRRTDSPRSSIS